QGRVRAVELAEIVLADARISKVEKEIVKQLRAGTGSSKIVKDLNKEEFPVSHQRLASLFSTKTFYDNGSRMLSFGTVVRFRRRKSDMWKYAICLMPACDSLRLDVPIKRFPFWTLEENVYREGRKGRIGFVLDCGDGDLISLAASGSAGDQL